MDFALTDEQKEVAALATKIFTDHEGKDAAATWAALTGSGLLGVAVADDVGGAGHGLLEHVALLAALGGAAAPVPLWTVATAALAIDHAGTPAQRARLAAVLDGSAIVALALEEPDGGDPHAPGTALRDGRLHGVKTGVAAADRAAHLVVSARDAAGEPALFLVDARGPGVAIEAQTATHGERVGLVTLVGAPAEPLGTAADFGWLLDRATVGLCAVTLGVCEKVLRMTATYTSQRVQFDRPIATFQAVAQRAADCYIDVETIRLTLWEAAWRLAQGLPADRQIAVAKLFAAEAGQRVTFAAQHLHGGIGFDLSYPLAKYYPLAKWLELNLGGAGAQSARLGALLAQGA